MYCIVPGGAMKNVNTQRTQTILNVAVRVTMNLQVQCRFVAVECTVGQCRLGTSIKLKTSLS